MIEYGVETNSLGHVTYQGGLTLHAASVLASRGAIAGITSKTIVKREVGNWTTIWPVKLKS